MVEFGSEDKVSFIRRVSIAREGKGGKGEGGREGRKERARELTFSLSLPSQSCIDFCISLNQHHNLSISKAYAISTAQFSHLRAIHEIAVRAASREAEAYGARLKAGEIVRPSFSPSLLLLSLHLLRAADARHASSTLRILS